MAVKGYTFTTNPKADKIGVMKEVDLAQKIGLNQKVLRKFRLEQLDPLDWYHEGKGNKCRVWWTECALAKAEIILKINIGRVVPDGEVMEVVKANFVNKRIIQCRRPNNELVYVRVRDAKKYNPRLFSGQPMVVTAKRNGDGWSVEGNGPRRRGFQ
jgi:hypothetical protein